MALAILLLALGILTCGGGIRLLALGASWPHVIASGHCTGACVVIDGGHGSTAIKPGD